MIEFLLTSSSIRPLYLLFPIIIYFSLEFLRRLKKQYYVPVYFPFALESINPDFAAYYGTEQMLGPVERSPTEIKAIERNIRIGGIVSALLSGYLIPIVSGFISSVILRKEEFYISVIVIFVIRFNDITRAIFDYDIYRTGFKSKKSVVAAVLYLYLISVIYFMFKGYMSGLLSAPKKDWWGYIDSFFGSTLVPFVWQGLLFGVMSTFLAQYLLDPKLRSEKLNDVREAYTDHVE